MRRTPSWWVFWLSLGVIIYTYFGFPLVLALRALFRPQAIKRGETLPTVSMIIAAYNEAEVITQKLDNTFALDYPHSHLEVIVASDGSDDGTNDLVARYTGDDVQFLALPRQGKNRTLNTAVARAHGDILVFSDADSMLEPAALRHLVAPFEDPQVGGVGGDYRHVTTDGKGSGERTYWNIDRMLKQIQSYSGSMTSASGAIYAMRRALYRPLPLGVTDDFFMSVEVMAAHRRLVFEPAAKAHGPLATSSRAEFRRKVRVITAGLRGVWLMRQLLNPLEYGFFAIQLFSHKVLRRLMVAPIMLIGLATPALWRRGPLYKLAGLAQLAVHGASVLGFLLRGTRIGEAKILSLPLFFNMVNLAAIVSLVKLLRGERHDIWVPQRASSDWSQPINPPTVELADALWQT